MGKRPLLNLDVPDLLQLLHPKVDARGHEKDQRLLQDLETVRALGRQEKVRARLQDQRLSRARVHDPDLALEDQELGVTQAVQTRLLRALSSQSHISFKIKVFF